MQGMKYKGGNLYKGRKNRIIAYTGMVANVKTGWEGVYICV